MGLASRPKVCSLRPKGARSLPGPSGPGVQCPPIFSSRRADEGRPLQGPSALRAENGVIRLQGLKSLATGARPPGGTSACSLAVRHGFSLVELMIAIIILGLGLVLVASMFPIAWRRAVQLNDFTNTTSCTDAAEAAVKVLCRIYSYDDNNTPGNLADDIVTPTGFIGDYSVWSTDAANAPVTSLEPLPGDAVGSLPLIPVFRVRPLLLENAHFEITDATSVANPNVHSNLTQTEPVDFPDLTTRYVDFTGAPVWELPPVPTAPALVTAPQVALWERVFPAMSRWEWNGNATLTPAESAKLAQWKQELESRRFAWGVLYKLDFPRTSPDPAPQPTPVPGEDANEIPLPLVCIVDGGDGASSSDPTDPASNDVKTGHSDPGAVVVSPGIDGVFSLSTVPMGDDVLGGRGQLPSSAAPRTFTLYYVTLKRTDPTQRFAVQSVVNMNPLPFQVNPASPMPSNESTTALPTPPGVTLGDPAPQYRDVMFPVPWRVQIKVNANVTPAGTWLAPSGIPSTAVVPDPSVGGLSAGQRRQMVAMFPVGQVFIDEVSGEVYRVTRRVLGESSSGSGVLDEATLTLDKEIQLHVDTIDDASNGDFTHPNWGNWTLDPDPDGNGPMTAEDSRVVWVYPPAIERRGNNVNNADFVGPSPVAGLEIRKLQLKP